MVVHEADYELRIEIIALNVLMAAICSHQIWQ